MDPTLLTTIILGVLGLLSAGYFGLKQVRSITAADKDRAAAQIREQLTEARQDERDICKGRLDAKDERISDLLHDIEAERNRADRAEARADTLQNLINQGRIGGGS